MSTMRAKSVQKLTRTIHFPRARITLFPRRFTSTTPPPKPNSQARIDRVHSRLPRFLQRYLIPLRNAPVSHIAAFLLLHEITAVVPLLGLAAFFHYSHWMPPFISEGKWIAAGVEKFGNYFRRKGWLGTADARRSKWWGKGETGTRWVVELAAAWAITKAILPVRIIFSVWATPWFARISIIPVVNTVKQWVGRKPTTVPTSNAPTTLAQPRPSQPSVGGTGATGGVVGKSSDPGR